MAITVKQNKERLLAQAKGEPARSILRRSLNLRRSFGRPIKSQDLIFFTSQLSLMLEIGTSLSQALKAIGNQAANDNFRGVVQAMHQDIEEGRQLSDAMKRHPRVFSNVVVSMVHAGESGGFLRKILDRITEMLEKRRALKGRLRSALTYPFVLCGLGLVVVVFILVGVLPMFTGFFAGKEHILPVTTRLLMMMSASLRDYWWGYILLSAGLALSVKLGLQSKQGRGLIDRFFVSAPLLARLSNKIYGCQLLRTLGSLLESQVSLLEALAVTRGTLSNRYYRDFVDQILDRVNQGGKLAESFAAFPYVVESVKQMVATGEEAGKLPRVMLRLAEHYDTEVHRDLERLASMIEPLALIVMGGVVGVIVSAVILPMFRLSHVLG